MSEKMELKLNLVRIDWYGPGGLIGPSWSEVLFEDRAPPYPHEAYFGSMVFHYVSATSLHEIDGLEKELKLLHADCNKKVEQIWKLLGPGYYLNRPGAIPPQRCLAYTKKGRRCKNHKTKGEDRCAVHMDIHYLDLAGDEWEGISNDEYSLHSLLRVREDGRE